MLVYLHQQTMQLITNINILQMVAIIDKRINWKETLIALKTDQPLVINKATIQDVQTARVWSSRLKKQGVITKVSLKGTVLTVKRLA